MVYLSSVKYIQLYSYSVQGKTLNKYSENVGDAIQTVDVRLS